MKTSAVRRPTLSARRVWSALSFHSRVLLLFVGLLILALFSASVAMFVAANRTGLGLAEQQLWVTDRVIQETFGYRDRQLRDSTNALAADFGFREAVSSNDRPTLGSALANQGARINADIALLMDDNGTVKASTGGTDSGDLPSLVDALNQVRAHNLNPAILKSKSGLLQMVIVPVHAPNIIGWVGMGFLIRDDVVLQVKETAGADISLVTGSAGAPYSVVASTLPVAARTALASGAGSLITDGQRAREVSMKGDDYLTLVTPGKSSVADAFSVIMQIPMSTVAAPLNALRRELFLSGAVILILCLSAAVVSARLIAQPVRALADAARSLTLSKRRSRPGPGQSDDELAHVAAAFHALAQRANYDSLTGLPNRSLLRDRLGESMERMKRAKLPLAVVFIDLNGFKGINDTLGHDMGDLVLRKTAQRLSQALTPPNMVARLGGDEFVLLLEGERESEVMKTVERLVGVVSTPMKAAAGSIKVGMSAGIAMYPELSLDREVLLKKADAAMYQSKTLKRGPVIARASTPAADQASGAPAVPPSAESKSPSESAILEGLPPSEGTWSGQWEGKDLATHVTRVLQVATPVSIPPYQPAPIPPREGDRLSALRRLKLLDSPSSALYDRITRLAAKALDVPMVLISLVDEKRQWFLSRVGIDMTETARDISFCAHVVYDGKPLVVGDATADPRFAGNPAVTEDLAIRAYVGVPLHSSSGFTLGTLCVMDKRPRNFSEQQLATLKDFTSIIEDYIQARERRVERQKRTSEPRDSRDTRKRVKAPGYSSDIPILNRD